MDDAQIRRDMEALAGRLTNRGSNTESERTAAEYLRDRFREHTADAFLDDFHSPDTILFLFASYYAEFLVVSLLAIWFPRIALCYGTVVFLAYLAEFTGHRVMARLLPAFETQNVEARFLCERPKRLVIVSAHYDTGKSSVLTHPPVLPWLRIAHLAVVVCMVLILISCATQALGIFSETPYPIDLIVRWAALCWLLGAAGILVYAEYTGEYVRGANNNASGVAALLRLAGRLAAEPLEASDVWLAAIGSKESWMSGMRRLLDGQALDKKNTYILNIECVGSGKLCYITGEGMLHVFPSSREMIEAAQKVANQFGARPHTLRAVPTDALIPLTRGFKTLGIAAVDDHGIPPHWRQQTDTLVHIEDTLIAKAADFAEAILREQDAVSEQSAS